MKKLRSLKLILFFTALTVVLTWLVILAYEGYLRQPFYWWVEAQYPGNKSLQDSIQQRIEHFFISTTVDVIVVSLLLRLVNRQQRKVRASEKRYRSLFEHAGDGIAVIRTTDHQLIDVNKRFGEIIGYKHRSLIGEHICDLLRSDGDHSGHGLLLDVFKYGESDQVGVEDTLWSKDAELTTKAASGSSLIVSASCSTLAADGQTLFVLMIRDLTAQRRLEREKQEMERHMQERLAHNEKIAALGRMAAQVAHEVKNPLAGLRLYSLHLKSKVEGTLPDNQMSLIEKILNGIDQLSNTTERVLNFARPLTLKRNRIDLNSIIGDSLSLLEPQLTAKKIKVELDQNGGSAYAVLDDTAMRSTLINLMLNSIDAMNEGGRLRVSTKLHDDSLDVEVADTGSGMTEEQIQNLFEPFYTSKSRGLGLGMCFVAKVIEQHRGKVAVESQPGNGTRIKISLPAGG